MPAAVCVIAIALLGALLLVPSDPRDGRELVALMRQRAHMYRTMTFVQTTKFPGRPDETWYESAQLPGMLRIDMTPLDSQRVSIFRNDSVYSMRLGRPTRARPYVHSLLVLLGDVFVLPAESSVAKLSRLGFDLSKLHEDSYEGRRVWVAGAERGDTTSNQFWIDAERLYMVRMIERQPGPQGQLGGMLDGKILEHQLIGGYWVETHMVFSVDGREVQRELYNDVRVNPALDPAIFVADQYRKPSWIP